MAESCPYIDDCGWFNHGDSKYEGADRLSINLPILLNARFRREVCDGDIKGLYAHCPKYGEFGLQLVDAFPDDKEQQYLLPFDQQSKR